MRKIFVAMSIFLFLINTNAQLSLEKTYNFSIGTIHLNSVGWKYFLMDVPLSQCRIYNTDHSIYKTISCPVPANNYLYDILFVTENFFNNDDKIELYYSYYEWITSGGASGTGYYKYGAKVINESGTVLQDITGGLYAYVYNVADDDARLFVYCYDNSLTPYKIWTNIYKVSGDASIVNSLKSSTDIATAFPNPASSTITISYVIPSDASVATIKVFDMNGQLVQTFSIDNTFNELLVDVSSYSSGVYMYIIEVNGKKINQETFFVN